MRRRAAEAIHRLGTLWTQTPPTARVIGWPKARLSEIATWLPEFAEQIKKIQCRLWDLLPVVRNHVYHPAFGGSFSLKAVLPALVPELTYENMAVANGQDAGLAWESLVRGNLDGAEHEKVRKALLDYCGQDTLALVRLLEALRHRTDSI